jgi:hypothetical protein
MFPPTGESLNFKGSLWCGVTIGDIDLTYCLREQIPVSGLFIFDGCEECDTEEMD